MKKLYVSLFFLIFIKTASWSATIYYSKSTTGTNLANVSSWGTNTNGTGTAPSNFTGANCTYIITNTVATIGANWTVSGANSSVQIGSGTAINFTISSNTIKAPISISGTSTLTITGGTVTNSTVTIPGAGIYTNTGTSYPSIGTLSSSSTVVYSNAGPQTITNGSYGNLTLSGSGTKSLATASSTTVTGVLTINSGIAFNINTNSSNTLYLNGTISGTGGLKGGTSSNLSIGGSGAFGSLIFTTKTLNNFTINRTSSGTISLGSALTVRGTFTHTNGILSLGSNSFTLRSSIVFPAAYANGSISGTNSSTFSISGTSGTITNKLYMTTGSQIGTFILSRSGANITLGNDLKITSAYTQTRGNIILNGQTFTLNGTVTLSSSAARGTTKGSTTSNLIINATSIATNALYMATGSETLNNFTLNSSGQTLTLGTKLTVGGSYSHTKGIVALNGQTLTLSGSVIFPTSSSNGTTTGTTASTLSVTATSITNPVCFTAGGQNLSDLSLNSPGQTLGLGSSLTVSGTLTHTSGILNLSNYSLSLTSAMVFPTSSVGSISGTNTSTLSITGSTISNKLYMTSGSQIGTFILNKSGANVTLGNDLNITTAYTQTKGNILLNGQTLTTAGTVTFASSAANGTIAGSTASNLIINATSISTNTLYMATGSETLNNFTLNSSGQTLTLGTKLTVGGSYSHTKGIVALNGQTLTLSGSVIFPTSSSNGTTTGTTASTLSVTATSITNPVCFTTGGESIKNITLNSSGQTLTLGSALTVSGVFTHTAGKIALNGQILALNSTIVFPASATNGSFIGSLSSNCSIGGSGTITNSFFMDQTSSSTKSLSHLTMNRTGRTITLGNELDIIDSISPTLGTVASGGNLVLVADQSTVGHVGRIGRVGGAVTGNVMSQIYHAPNTNITDWRLMGVAGLTGVGFSQWNATSTGGSGVIPITCPTCPYTSVGGVAFSSITTYNESSETYPDITYSSTMIPGVGYWIYMGSGSPGATSAPYLVNVTGAAKTGNVTVPLTSSGAGVMKGYNLLANPYASPVLFSKLKVVNPSVDNSWWTYSPVYGDNAGYVGGISTPAYSHGGTGIDGVIPAGMGFFVHVNSATTFSFNETVKTNGSNETLLRTEDASSGLTFFRMQISDGANMMNEAVVRLDANATTGFDADYDLPDMPPAAWGWLQIATASLGEYYAVNGLPDGQPNYSIPVKITSGTTGAYQFTTVDLQNMPSGACISLHDNYTNNNYDLRSGPFSLTINDSETVARFTLNINIDNNITITSAYQAPSCPNSSNGFIIADAGTGVYNYYWKDSTDNIIQTDLNHAGSDTLFNVGVGQYHVNAGVSGTCNNGSQDIVIQANNYVTAAFIPSSQHDSLSGDTAVGISFTNNSANATQFFWNFGDGQTDSVANPTHSYTYADSFNVILYAINAACGDTAIYSETIVIDTLTSLNEATSGIVSISANNSMHISRDPQGYYVQFDYQKPVDAIISVQNLLGQKIVADTQQHNATNNKAYIYLGNTENNMLIISVINSRGEKVTRRVINQ